VVFGNIDRLLFVSLYRAPSASKAEATMPLDELNQYILSRADRKPVATNRSMLDSYVITIVAGPVSFNPREWIYPLLAITKMRLIVLVRWSSQRSPWSRCASGMPSFKPYPGAWSHCLQS
jgi:hypothetical protein